MLILIFRATSWSYNVAYLNHISYLFFYHSMHLYIELLCVCYLSHTLTQAVQASSGIINRHLHLMPLKLELFPRETTCILTTVISTVSVCVAVASLPAPSLPVPLAIKGSARNRQDVTWDWPVGHLSRPVMWEIDRFWSLADQSVHL